MIPLLVIRHAPTDWNAAKLIQGRTDRPLSAAGRAQAAGWRLPPGWEGAQCLASPLRRAVETALLLGLSPTIEPRLIETDWGEWEGHNLDEVRARLGEVVAKNEASGREFNPPGGESPRAVQERLLPFLDSLSEATVAVTHKGVLRALYALATGWDMRAKPRDKLRDGCAHSFSVTPGSGLKIDALNMPLEAPR